MFTSGPFLRVPFLSENIPPILYWVFTEPQNSARQGPMMVAERAMGVILHWSYPATPPTSLQMSYDSTAHPKNENLLPNGEQSAWKLKLAIIIHRHMCSFTGMHICAHAQACVLLHRHSHMLTYTALWNLSLLLLCLFFAQKSVANPRRCSTPFFLVYICQGVKCWSRTVFLLSLSFYCDLGWKSPGKAC